MITHSKLVNGNMTAVHIIQINRLHFKQQKNIFFGTKWTPSCSRPSHKDYLKKCPRYWHSWETGKQKQTKPRVNTCLESKITEQLLTKNKNKKMQSHMHNHHTSKPWIKIYRQMENLCYCRLETVMPVQLARAFHRLYFKTCSRYWHSFPNYSKNPALSKLIF